jgi:uncharacterized repeat protein (TIGR01451 family)
VSPLRGYSTGGGGGGTCPPIAWTDKVKETDALGAMTAVVQDKVKATDTFRSNPLLLPDKVKITDLVTVTGTPLFPDKVKVTDAFGPDTLVLRDKLKLTDGFGTHTLLLPDKVKITDNLIIPSGTFTFTDKVKETDKLTLTFSTHCPRSASPNQDAMSDSWDDQANATTNHGADTQLQVIVPVLGMNEKRCFIQFDMRIFTNFTALTGGTHQFQTTVNNANAVQNPGAHLTATLAQNGNAAFFQETSVTWNSPPAAGTTIATYTITVPNTGNTTMTVAFTDAQVNSMLGNYCMLSFVGTNTLDTVTLMNSRENASPWTLQFQLQR